MSDFQVGVGVACIVGGFATLVLFTIEAVDRIRTRIRIAALDREVEVCRVELEEARIELAVRRAEYDVAQRRYLEGLNRERLKKDLPS
jgi:hypothetical protein